MNSKVYLVMESCLMEAEILNPGCSKSGIKLVKYLWKQDGSPGPREGVELLGPVVFQDDPTNPNDCVTHTLDVALQKMQLKFDIKVAENKIKAEDCLLEIKKYSKDIKKLVLGKDSYTSPFTGQRV
jgi:hypothetical protein